MKLFDCYCAFGELAVGPPSYARSPEELLEEMEFCGIAEALVYYHPMRHGSPVTANRTIVEKTKANPNLHPTWAILPHQTDEQATPDVFLGLMKESGVRALYAFPVEHGYLLDAAGFGELLEELTEHKIPLFMKPNWPLVASVLSEFPRLTLVAAGHGPHGQDRYFRPLIEKYPGLHIDTSGYLQDGGIEAFCDKYGPERMLFGTGYPGNCMGGPVLRIAAAQIKESHRELIACGNMARILGEVKL